jgi:hypothetical protein
LHIHDDLGYDQTVVNSDENEKLKTLIRNISRSHLTQQGLAEDVQILDLEFKPLVYSHWMAIVLVTSKQIKITFKTHFKTRNAQLLAAPLFGLPPNEVSTDRAADCMREYCNLTAGGIKRALLSHMETHLSLPIITRGFDELFFALNEGRTSLEDRWILAYRDNQIICTSSVVWLEQVDLTGLDENQDSGTENTTGIEFL